MSELRRRSRPAAIAFLGLAALLSAIAIARAESVSGDNVHIAFRGRIVPRALPRSGSAPVALHVVGRVQPLGPQPPAALAQLTLQVNRHAVFTDRGLPSCAVRRLRGTSTQGALRNCGPALIGSGYFTSHIDIPEEAPFPAFGRVLAFNVSHGGRHAVAIHVFGRHPASITTVLAAGLTRSGPSSGPFGPQIRIEMPRIGDEWGYVTGFDLTLHRRYRYGGRQMSVVSASCPAPRGLNVVPFKAARAIFQLVDGATFTRTLEGSCVATK
jgi:hypothetical protein